jgi:hypothetical protein
LIEIKVRQWRAMEDNFIKNNNGEFVIEERFTQAALHSR